MKRFALVLGCLAAGGVCRAQWAVIDAANLSQSIMNYAVMVQQIAKQGEQITNQVQQIQQMSDQLNRMGKMSDYLSLVGFPELELDIATPTKIQTWTGNQAGVTGSGLFGDTRGGVYSPVNANFVDMNGQTVARDPSLYKPAQDITATIDNFKQVQSDVYARRAELRQAIAKTSAALQAAATDAEEKKLADILNAQYGELASLDTEVMLSAAEIQAKANEAAAMSAAKGQADTETRTQTAQEEAQKLTATFKPTYASVLQYLNEQPYQP